MIPIQNRLKEKRSEKNITQEQLSELVGVSRQTIISLENGKYNPSLELAFKLAKVFGCQIEDIFIYQEGE